MNALRKWRKAAQLTVEQTATLLLVSGASISRIERGEQWPDQSFFARLADVTNGAVTPNDFMASPLPHVQARPHAKGGAA